MVEPFLMIDMGGTNIRFSTYDGAMSPVITYQTHDYGSLMEAMKAYEAQSGRSLPRRIVMGVPGPVMADKLVFLNNLWSFSKAELIRQLGLTELKVVNDFEPQAMAIPYLADKDLLKIGGGDVLPGYPKAVLGPGTGLGATYLISIGNGWRSIATEGGHVSIPIQTDREFEIYSYLRRRYDHISAERVISGNGLALIYEALCAIHGVLKENLSPEEIMAQALKRADIPYKAVIHMFDWLGVVAGDMAMILSAFGGTYITGGIIRQPGVLDLFKESHFRARFEDKGRRSAFMKQMPTFVVTTHNRAFVGLQHMMDV